MMQNKRGSETSKELMNRDEENKKRCQDVVNQASKQASNKYWVDQEIFCSSAFFSGFLLTSRGLKA